VVDWQSAADVLAEFEQEPWYEWHEPDWVGGGI
jgi:hypothetical protein